MKSVERRRLIRAKRSEIRRWARATLEIGKHERLRIDIIIRPVIPPPRAKIDEEYVLTKDDWARVKQTIKNARGYTREYLTRLVTRKFVQFPEGRGTLRYTLALHLKREALPFVLRALYQRGVYFTDEKYRLYKKIE